MQTPWGLCWKMESSNFWRNAISFMSPISLAAIEWCKTNLCATYIRQNLSNVSNVDKKPKHVHKHCKDYKDCHSLLSWHTCIKSWFQFSNVSLIVNNVTKAVNSYIACAVILLSKEKNSRIDMTSFIFGWTPIWHRLCWTPHPQPHNH